MKCSMCTIVIAVSDHPTSFYAHVKLYHKTARNFHIICKHPGCQNHYHNFISFKRHWNKKHGSTVTQITPNIVNEVNNMETAVNPASDHESQLDGVQIFINNNIYHPSTSPENDLEWEAGILLRHRHQFFLPYEALILVSDAIHDNYNRSVLTIQEKLSTLVSTEVFGSTAFKAAFDKIHHQELAIAHNHNSLSVGDNVGQILSHGDAQGSNFESSWAVIQLD